MIDWLTFTIDAIHEPISSGRVVSLTGSGEVEWDVPKRMSVRGSYDSTVQVRSVGQLNDCDKATQLYVSGNPSKFLQGQNVHGSMDLLSLTASLMAEIETILQTSLGEGILNAQRGHFRISRIDIAKSYRFADCKTVDAALAALLVVARGRNGRAIGTGSTVYVGKKSRRWSMKFYNKGVEIKKHPLPEQLTGLGIEQYAQGLLRVELTLRGLELGDLKQGVALSAVINELHGDYMERVGVPLQVEVEADHVTSMPRAIRCTYLQWDHGIDVRPSMSKTTFYKHRSDLLRYGVDIASPKAAAGTVIPLFKTVAGEEEQAPSEWYDRHLIHVGRLRNVS